MDRRHFVTALAGATAAPGLSSLLPPSFSPNAIRRLIDASEVAKSRGHSLLAADAAAHRPDPVADAAFASDEDFWEPVQRAFDLDRTWINLNNGGCSPAPSHVMAQMERDLRYSNELPVIHMWRDLEPRIEVVRRELAIEFGCDTEEMAITRNASEALETLIFGMDLKAGDEVIVSNQNYGRMLNAWKQRVRREGIVLKEISFPVPPSSPQVIVDAFAKAMTPRTRVIEITHITNLTGQILPVKEIVAMARAKNVEVFVDGAHAFAHFPFTRDELGVDYYGTSLHKWLLAPIGTGFLYIRKAKQKQIWPLMAASLEQDNDIRKYEEIGTHPAANHNAISVALTFHRSLGVGRKYARLTYLRDRWAKRLIAEGKGRVRMLTPTDNWGGGIGFLQVDGLDPVKLGNWLHGTHRVVQTPIVHPEFSGIRVTPNVYTTLDEIDRFGDLVLRAMRNGIA
ncbi:MAG: aminotransferase class V-fold PLP-dependent enzyme [Gemmatimonadaceae bacterium]|nr:aminotransferase class V-fold PLP-dependent enzyme [Gemmatimonadaceae bacterium]